MNAGNLKLQLGVANQNPTKIICGIMPIITKVARFIVKL